MVCDPDMILNSPLVLQKLEPIPIAKCYYVDRLSDFLVTISHGCYATLDMLECIRVHSHGALCEQCDS